MNLPDILDEILQREGWPQITNYPYDKGGLTKGGITFTSYNAWLKQKGRKALTPTEFRDITDDNAREFLLESIAGPLMQVSMVDLTLFTIMFDWATTSGPDDPIRALQNALRERHHILKADGIYGMATDATLHGFWDGARTADRLGLIEDMRQKRVQFYLMLALNDKVVVAFLRAHPETQLRNLHGWINRAQSV